jgi:hypothetical protein
MPGLHQPLAVPTIHQSLFVDVCQPDDDRLPATAAVDLEFVIVHARRERKKAADGPGSTASACSPFLIQPGADFSYGLVICRRTAPANGTQDEAEPVTMTLKEWGVLVSRELGRRRVRRR